MPLITVFRGVSVTAFVTICKYNTSISISILLYSVPIVNIWICVPFLSHDDISESIPTIDLSHHDKDLRIDSHWTIFNGQDLWDSRSASARSRFSVFAARGESKHLEFSRSHFPVPMLSRSGLLSRLLYKPSLVTRRSFHCPSPHTSKVSNLIQIGQT